KFGFASKRKTLENNLAAGLHISKKEASDIIKSAGLAEKVRAEELSIDDWKKLNLKFNPPAGGQKSTRLARREPRRK
ncbi:MAG: hypothetical protein Q8K77_05495, partial [Thermodesulfovibrionales bacterium]|nr:hypothetical protein [Thermodesulfovibrionales bacterium]